MRLDKLLCDLGAGTRSEVKEIIKKGRVRVDGIVAKAPDLQLKGAEELTLDGRPIRKDTVRYYMLNKPAGMVTARTDAKDRAVMELFAGETVKDLSPVGRLDKDTVGLLLVTNDGELAHRLLSPTNDIEKTYFAKVDGLLTEEDLERIRGGVKFKEFTSKPAKITVTASDETSGTCEVTVTVSEGKYHEVKRLIATSGHDVTYLKRIVFAGLSLDDKLAEGRYRELSASEIDILKEKTYVKESKA